MNHPARPARHDGTRYVIRLGGHLHPRWSARLDGMTLTHLDDGTTVLDGEVADQAALHGLLRTLRDLGVPLVSLTRIDPTTGTRSADDVGPCLTDPPAHPDSTPGD